MQPGQRRMKLMSCPKNGMKNFLGVAFPKIPENPS